LWDVSLYEKNDLQQKKFMEDFAIFAKGFIVYFCCGQPTIEVFSHAPKCLKCVS
jgi:hypothetical protein